MKKLLYLFITSAFLISCESDNDTDADPIIGTWQLTSQTENGTEISTDCQRKTEITFLENGTTSEIYYYDNGNNTCDFETDSANWENLGNSNYNFNYDDIYGETVKIIFSQNNKI